MKRKRAGDHEETVAALRAGVTALSVSSAAAAREFTCRDAHVKAIVDFLNDKVHPVMQIFGMPGTGKTASVNRALALLAHSAPLGKRPTAVFLNGYVIQKNSDIYWTLNSHLSKARLGHTENCSPDQCAALIEKRFRQGWGSSSTPLCVIVIDEVDKVLKKHHKAFFRIVDWLSFPFAFCKLITISNSMELAADAKTRSRLDITKRLVFEPYSLSELKEILLQRVNSIKPTLFAEKAVNYLCNQTASHYGDVRRLLQSASAAVCGLMMKMEEGYRVPEEQDGLLTVKDVHAVVRQIFHDRFVEFIQTVRLPIVFLSMAVIANETARHFQTNPTDSRLPLDMLFSATKRAQESFSASLGEPHFADLNYGAYLEIVEMLREVALIDVSIGEERIPVKTTKYLFEATEQTYVSMLQPFPTVVDACKLHDIFGSKKEAVMPPKHGGNGVSGFTAAAKVLFDSAAKVGAVEPLGVANRLYAQQLKKMQTQSRKKGGSLGSVSYKVAEFLSTQRTPKANIVRTSTSIAKRVPLIDIPLQHLKKQEMTIVEKARTEKVPLLDFISNKKQTPPAQPTKTVGMATQRGTSHAESLLTDSAVPPLDFVSEKRNLVVVSLDTEIIEKVKKEEEKKDPVAVGVEAVGATIAEDKPLFQLSSATEPRGSLLVEHEMTSVFEKMVYAPKRPAKPTIVLPISSEPPTSSTQRVETTQSETMSVDVWEMQREREIAELRKSQEKAERERLAMEREEEHTTLGDEWVRRRTLANTSVPLTDAASSVIEKMYFSNQWEACFQYFEQLVAMPTPAIPLFKQAVRLMERRLKCVPWEQREAVRLALLDQLRQRKLKDEVARFELRQQQGVTFLQLYRSTPGKVKDTLDFPTVLKAVPALVGAGFWEEAIELVDKSQQRFSDKTGLLELKLLASAGPLNQEASKAVTEYVSKTLGASERFGKIHKLQMVKMEKGARRRQMISQLISSTDVDEEVYAELLRITPKENVNDVLDEVRKRGLNTEDPAIFAVLCWKAFDAEKPHVLFQEIARQETKIGIRPVHVLIAIAMSRVSKTRDTLRSTIDIVKRASMVRAKFTLRKLLPLLYEKNMCKEIVELADFYKDHVPIATALPHAVAFVNDALRAEGRPPLSEQTTSSLQIREKEPGEKVSFRTTSLVTIGNEISTETMLQCAKERNWMRALDLINSISPQFMKSTDTDTVTLIYNCALSASVENADLAKSIYNIMLEKGVLVNATTNNAVLSSLMRSEQSREAIEFYKQTDPSLQDNNTYSVMLSLYGKMGMWEDAVGLIRGARTKSTKLSPILYTLGINAVHNHNWSATLILFQTLRKEHGSHVIKDAVVDKVVRCLSQNKRIAELQKLEAELTKMKKK